MNQQEAPRLLTLLEFAKVMFSLQYNESYEILSFHKDLETELMKRVTGKTSKNLFICMPPRFGKSVLGIRVFTSWILSIFPDSKFIIAANTSDLARDHVKEIRNVIRSDWYQRLFPYGAKFKQNKIKKKKTEILSSSTRSDHFATLQGGEVKGIGLGGLITGFGAGQKRPGFAGCIFCDDLLKEQDCFSPTQRDIAYNWFKNTISSRKNKDDTPMILIMQRLHPDDLVGRLLNEEPQKWDIINIPALDPATQKSNWEKAKSTASLLEMQNSEIELDKYLFLAKYQQTPTMDISSAIKAHWWVKYRGNAPYHEITTRIITMDTAYKAKTYNDESVMQLWGLAQGDKAYLLDMDHGRWEFPELLERTKQFYKKHNKILYDRRLGNLYIEDKASGTSLAQTLQREGVPAKLWLPINTEPKDKMSRVLEATRFIAAGRVLLPDDKPFTNDFIRQCSEFSPEGVTHDDMVDAMTMALMIWRRMGAK